MEERRIYLCSFCNQELNVPTKSQSCAHIFCYFCINNWLQKNSGCPLRCTSSLSKELVYLSPLELEEFENVPMRCAYHLRGCQQVLVKHSYAKHVQKCVHQSNTYREDLEILTELNRLNAPGGSGTPCAASKGLCGLNLEQLAQIIKQSVDPLQQEVQEMKLKYQLFCGGLIQFFQNNFASDQLQPFFDFLEVIRAPTVACAQKQAMPVPS